MFIDHQDNIYLAAMDNSQILVYKIGQTIATRTLSVTSATYTTFFVSLTGDVYFAPANPAGSIAKWPYNTSSWVTVAQFSGDCDGFFLDNNNSLYCSLRDLGRIDKISLNSSNISAAITVVGAGSQESSSYQLFTPWGIFVDTDLNLYVADINRHTIRMFRPGQPGEEIVAGLGKPDGLELKHPTDVIMDGNGYLYIADNEGHRIVRSGKNHFVCLAGCSKNPGLTANELHKPYSIRLDSGGTLYVADEYNYRVQRFQLISDGCGKCNRTLATK